MPTRYGSPDATIRTLPHRQPPVNRSMLRLLQDQAIGMDATVTARGTTPRRTPRCTPSPRPCFRRSQTCRTSARVAALTATHHWVCEARAAADRGRFWPEEVTADVAASASAPRRAAVA